MVNTCNRVELYVEGPASRRSNRSRANSLGNTLVRRSGPYLPAPRMNEDAARTFLGRSRSRVDGGGREIAAGAGSIDGWKEGTVAPSLERLFRAASRVFDR